MDSDQKSIPVVGFLTCNDCDVLRAKTGVYRRVTHKTIIPPTVSNGTIAGILSVTTEDGEIQPVAFYSRTLQSAERNYDTHNKELLAIFEVFKSWQHFLEGSATTIDTVTDHKNLEYFTSTNTKKLTCNKPGGQSSYHSST